MAQMPSVCYHERMTHPIPSGYHIEKSSSVAEGLRRVWAAGLCVSDEATSHVQPLADPRHNPTAQGVSDVWLAVHTETGADVGMGLIADPNDQSRSRPIFHMYVHHQNLGLGTALLRTALAENANMCGHHTLDAVRLYHDHNVPPACVVMSDEMHQIERVQGWEAVQVAYTQAVLAERLKYDEFINSATPRHRLGR